MWLHISGCCPFTNVYNKQMTPIRYFQAAGDGGGVLVELAMFDCFAWISMLKLCLHINGLFAAI